MIEIIFPLSDRVRNYLDHHQYNFTIDALIENISNHSNHPIKMSNIFLTDHQIKPPNQTTKSKWSAQNVVWKKND